MEKISKLFDAYAANDITAEESRELCALLRSSDAAVDCFVRECFLDWQLFALFRQRTVHAGIINAPDMDDAADCGLPAAPSTLEYPGFGRGSSRPINFRALLAVAASLAIAVGGVLWTLNRPQVVGQLTQARADVQWATTDGNPGVGALLHAGRDLHLRQGRVLLTLVSGAQVVVEGPAVVRLLTENEISLESGRLGATVPPQATGFAVETQIGRFVDLGTEFTLDVQAPRVARLYVFAGLVDVQPAQGPSFKVPQSKAIDYDAASGVARPLAFGQEQRLSL